MLGVKVTVLIKHKDTTKVSAVVLFCFYVNEVAIPVLLKAIRGKLFYVTLTKCQAGTLSFTYYDLRAAK